MPRLKIDFEIFKFFKEVKEATWEDTVVEALCEVVNFFI